MVMGAHPNATVLRDFCPGGDNHLDVRYRAAIVAALGDGRTLGTTFEIFDTVGPATTEWAQLFSRLRPDPGPCGRPHAH